MALFHQPFDPRINCSDEKARIEIGKKCIKDEFGNNDKSEIKFVIRKRLDRDIRYKNSEQVEKERIDKKGKQSERNEVYWQADKGEDGFDNKKHNSKGNRADYIGIDPSFHRKSGDELRNEIKYKQIDGYCA